VTAPFQIYAKYPDKVSLGGSSLNLHQVLSWSNRCNSIARSNYNKPNSRTSTLLSGPQVKEKSLAQARILVEHLCQSELFTCLILLASVIPGQE
jgi:hypothetical protein